MSTNGFCLSYEYTRVRQIMGLFVGAGWRLRKLVCRPSHNKMDVTEKCLSHPHRTTWRTRYVPALAYHHPHTKQNSLRFAGNIKPDVFY